jgi:hypothetical protein
MYELIVICNFLKSNSHDDVLFFWWQLNSETFARIRNILLIVTLHDMNFES